MLNICYFTMLSFTINFVLIKSDRALLFNLDPNLLIEKKEGIFSDKAETETLCQNCAAACPPLTLEEVKYNFKKSVSKNVLLLEKIYDVPVNMDKIEVPVCMGSIEPSIVFDKHSGLLETGYEIHDTKNIVDPSQLKTKTDKFLSLYPPCFFKNPKPKQVLKSYLESNAENLPSEENAENFIWVPVLSIDININTMSPIQIEYNPDSGIHQPRDNCYRFDVGKEFYETKSPDFFYSHENQKLLFTGESESTTSSKKKLLCGQKYGCLVQHQVIPSYYMHTYYGSLATCAHMNTVPIWEGIVERINIVDRYLYAMTQIWGSSIHIINGFSGVFKPPKKHFKKMPTSEQELYLDEKNKNIPVPMIFYKIVEYRINIPPPQPTTEHYFAVIIIHNDPTPISSKQRICEKKDIVSGWEGIQNTESSSGLTYVCGFNKNVAYKLNLFGKENMKDRSPLILDDMTSYDAKIEKYSYQDGRFDIGDKLKELFPNGKY